MISDSTRSKRPDEVFGTHSPAQISSKRSFDQRFLQLFEKPIVAGVILRLLMVGEQLIKQSRRLFFGTGARRSPHTP
jgi:hypothetical protein